MAGRKQEGCRFDLFRDGEEKAMEFLIIKAARRHSFRIEWKVGRKEVALQDGSGGRRPVHYRDRYCQE